jgi:hypothetical protein
LPFDKKNTIAQIFAGFCINVNFPKTVREYVTFLVNIFYFRKNANRWKNFVETETLRIFAKFYQFSQFLENGKVYFHFNPNHAPLQFLRFRDIRTQKKVQFLMQTGSVKVVQIVKNLELVGGGATCCHGARPWGGKTSREQLLTHSSSSRRVSSWNTKASCK